MSGSNAAWPSRGKKPKDSAASRRTLASGSFNASMRGGTALAGLFHPQPNSWAALTLTSGLSLFRSAIWLSILSSDGLEAAEIPAIATITTAAAIQRIRFITFASVG